MDKKDRLDAIIKHFGGGNASQFANLLGVSPSTISTWKARNTIDYDLIFAKCENLSASWLLSGSGNMLKTKEKEELLISDSKLKVKRINEARCYEPIKEIQSIPLYNIVATAGIKEFVDNSSQFATEFIQIPNIPTCDGAIHISGNSMEPILKSGEIVTFKMLPPVLDSIIYGRIYIISYIAGGDANVVIKRIEKSDEGEPYIKLVSENPIHKSLDIDVRRVNALATVKASISVNSIE